jgi:hypothetical protein
VYTNIILHEKLGTTLMRQETLVECHYVTFS